MEAYGSEKGDLSVDDITNVLKIHGEPRMVLVCFLLRVFKNMVLNAPGGGGGV